MLTTMMLQKLVYFITKTSHVHNFTTVVTKLDYVQFFQCFVILIQWALVKSCHFSYGHIGSKLSALDNPAKSGYNFFMMIMQPK